MNYTLRLIFEGVCAFVPDKPFFTYSSDKWTPGKPESMCVLIPDLKRAEKGATRPIRDAHFPAITFDIETLVRADTNRFVDLVFREDGSTKEQGLCILRQEIVKLGIEDGRPKDFQFASAIPKEKEKVPRTVDEARSVFWLPRIAEISEDHEYAAKKLNPSKFQLCPPELVAAIQVDRGFFRCFNFNRDDSGDPRVWRFATTEDREEVWNRAIGNRWALEIFGLTKPFSLELDMRTNDPMTTRLTFLPRFSESLVEIEFSNLEPEQLFSDSALHIEGSPDPDFEEFYRRISSKPIGEHPVVPNLKKGQSGLGDVRKPCAPATFSGFG